MKGKNFSIGKQRVKYIAMDLVMSALAFFLFNIFRYDILGQYSYGYPTLYSYLRSDILVIEQIVVPLGLLAIYVLSGYYNSPVERSRVTEFSVTFFSVLFSAILLYFVLLINDTTGIKSVDYEIILVLFALLLVLVYTGRWLITSQTIRHLRKRHWKYSTLIIGNSKKSREIYKRLKQGGSVWAYNVVGFIRLENEHNINDSYPTWDWNDVERICKEYDIDQLILAPEHIRDKDIMYILERLFPLDLPVKIAPDTLSFVTGNIRLNDILGIPFIDLTAPRLNEFEKNVKRLFDIMASVITMTVLSPMLALTALTVRLTSKGPVIYRQERMGKGHKPFQILKFRSMKADAEKEGPMLSSNEDDRITPFGRFMRKYRIDELPQFWNVLKGEMSLVGPRPEREYYIEQIIKSAPYYGLIFQVRPGVTSWGMVKYGYASNVKQMVERSRYDLLYINNMSLTTDIKIMIYTVRTVIKGAGV